MEKIEVCPNCGHVFEILESQMAKAGASRCPVCGRKGEPVSATPEGYKKMEFADTPQGTGQLDSKTWLILGAILVAGIFTFLAGSWMDRICGIVFILALAAFYLIERMQLEKKWKKKD